MSEPHAGYLARAAARLEEIRAEQPSHELGGAPLPPETVDFSSNDYLGMAVDPQVVAALKHATRVGAGGTRLVGAHDREHGLLEEELAQWLGRERALVFSSGYAAAIGAIPVLAQLCETIVSDAHNHASLIDGMRLAPTPCATFAHATIPPRSPDCGGALVVTESLFGADGDAIDVAALLGALGEDDILLIDEANALGLAGAQGAGIARGFGDRRIAIMGTLAGAVGAHGGFIAGPAPSIELLANRARTFLFDAALPPAVVLAARVALVLIRKAGDRRARVAANAARLRDGLRRLGFHLPAAPAFSPIVPVEFGDEARALEVSTALLERRVYAPALRPPMVAAGTSRLLFVVRSGHAPEHVDVALSALARCIAL